MTTNRLRPARRRSMTVAALLVVCALLGAGIAHAVPTARISGNGSSWAGNALADFMAATKAQGVTVDFTPDGSSSGRKNFAQGLADFAVSEIPYKGDTADPQDQVYPNFSYAMLPAVAGGSSFMYNLPVNGQKFRQLKLSQEAIAKIFSGQIDRWNHADIKATNPGVNLPDQRITVVVRSDGSGATAQFTLWMLRQFPQHWAALCAKTGCNAKSATSYFPYQGLKNFTAQSQSNGVTTYTANTPYTINYDEYSYALGVNFPVAQVQNAAGFFTVPTDKAVAVALTQTKINTDKNSENYLSQDLSGVYPYKDPRTYPISAYSYLMVPTQTRGNFSAAKGATLGYFSTYALCEGQRSMGALGYSPLPMNLVLAALDQVLQIPGVDADTKKTISDTKSGVSSGSSNPCNNPTFRPGDSPSHNLLIDTAPFPEGCDAKCQAPWRGKSSGQEIPGTPKGKKKKGSSDAPTAGQPDAPAAGAPTAPGAAGGAPGAAEPVAACDPDTGLCGPGTITAGDAVQASASPAVIDGGRTWGVSQLALGLSALLAVLLVLAPPAVGRALDRRKPGRPGSSGGSPRE